MTTTASVSKRAASWCYKPNSERATNSRIPISVNVFQSKGGLLDDSNNNDDHSPNSILNTPVRSRSEELTLTEQTNSPFRSYLPFTPLNKKSANSSKSAATTSQTSKRRGSNRFDSKSSEDGNDSDSPTTASTSSTSLLRRSLTGMGGGRNNNNRNNSKESNRSGSSNNNNNNNMLNDDDDDDVSLGSFTEITSTPGQKGGKAKLLSASCSNLSNSCSSLCSSARRKVVAMCELSFSNLTSLATPELDGNGGKNGGSLRNSGKAKAQRYLFSIRKAKKLTASVHEFVNLQSQRERTLQAQVEDVTRLAKARHANGSIPGAVLAMRKLIALRDKVECCRTAIDTATEGLWDLEEKIRRAEKKLDLLQDRNSSTTTTKPGDATATSKKHKSYKIDLGPNAKILEECQEILENNVGGGGASGMADDDASVAPDTTMDDQSLLRQLQEL